MKLANMKFKVGDLVRIKKGHPYEVAYEKLMSKPMKIEGIRENEPGWYHFYSIRRRFPEDALELVESADGKIVFGGEPI